MVQINLYLFFYKYNQGGYKMKYKALVRRYREHVKQTPNEDYWISPTRIFSKIRYDKKLNQEIDDSLRKYNNKIKSYQLTENTAFNGV